MKLKPTKKTYTDKLTTLITISLLLSACATPLHTSPLPETNTSRAISFARSQDFIVLITQRGDTLQSLAREHLGDSDLWWKIADYNHIKHINRGLEIVIPLKDRNPVSIHTDGYQQVPILCYHRFDDQHPKLSVNRENFKAQMHLLKQEGYRVIPLSKLINFINGKASIPEKSVVITIDDGYLSFYDTAFPVLDEYKFPATVFLYSDFINARDALRWEQIREMSQDGLIDFQPHSKTHPNLALRETTESENEYRQRIQMEIALSSSSIKQKLGTRPTFFAYPYGSTNQLVMNTLRDNRFQLGLTVDNGSNAAYASPYLLQRSMVFGEHSIDEFRALLKTFHQENLAL